MEGVEEKNTPVKDVILEEQQQQQQQQHPPPLPPNEERDNEEVNWNAGPKFQPMERVYARDTSSGLWYEAIIRRTMFGINHNKQVVIGLVSNDNEIEDALAQPEAPTWHYFVHYQKWAVNWDRWVSEEDVMDFTEESKARYMKYMTEHKQLLQEFKKKKKKKGRPSNGTEFLKEWRKRMDRIEEEIKKEREDNKKSLMDGDSEPSREQEGKDRTTDGKDEDRKTQAASAGSLTKLAAKPKPKKAKKAVDKWDKASVEKEYKLRLQGLEGKENSQQKLKMAMPFSLKKEMVEAWELITTCQMVADLPAKMTVRKALDKYLESKLELIVKKTPEGSEKTTPAFENPTTTEQNSKQSVAADMSSKDGEEETEEEKALQKRKQEWIDMVEGIAMFFDDALPFRLLYREELPQYRVAESSLEVPIGPIVETPGSKSTAEEGKDDAMEVDTSTSSSPGDKGSHAGTKHDEVERVAADKTQKTRPMLPSDVYGCESLLRLCLKLPDLLNENNPKVFSSKGDEDGTLAQEALNEYEKQCKQILAKVNDLIRFLHKHQSTMFIETYRKQNEAEQREEQKWTRYIERKRKRALQDVQESSATHELDTPTDTSAAAQNGLPPAAKKPLLIHAEA